MRTRSGLWLPALALTALVTGAALTQPVQAAAQSAGPVAGEAIQINGDGIPIQTYRAPDDSFDLHTIYWAKGIQPPLMTENTANYGKKGYFDLSTEYDYYMYYTDTPLPGEPNPGYYDFNKSAFPDQKALCFVATSANLIQWWLDQNSDYIDQYLERLENGFFVQSTPKTDGELVDISDPEMWKKLRTPPTAVKSAILGGVTDEILWHQSLDNNPKTTDELSRILAGEYRGLKNGGWMDTVLAFFFNGYPGRERVDLSPVPERYTPDPAGGYFYPIFGRTPLAQQHRTQSYDFYRDSFRTWLLDGKGVGLSFYLNQGATAGPSHAITLWGAEYDSSGQLCRIFVTDSDDASSYHHHFYDGAPVSVFLYSFEIQRESGGDLLMTTQPNTAHRLQGAVDLSLGRDIWQAAMADQDPQPSEPEFLTQPVSRSYAAGAKADRLTVEVSDPGTPAFLTYQWYEASGPDDPGTPISGETQSSYVPSLGSGTGTRYYYCQVTNHKFGRIVRKNSDVAVLTITEGKVVDAKLPKFQGFSTSGVICNQGDSPVIHVNASSPDNGSLTYQWFRTAYPTTNDLVDPVTTISDSPDFYPPTDKVGQFIYYCRVTNVNTAPSITGLQRQELNLALQPVTVTVNRPPENPPCTLTFAAPGALAMDPLTGPRGKQLASLPTPTRTGYEFDGWYADPQLEQKLTAPYTLEGDATLYAGWTRTQPRQIEYNVDSMDGSSDSFSVQLTNLAAAEADRLLVVSYAENGRMLGLWAGDVISDPWDLPSSGGTLTVTIPTPGITYDGPVRVFILPGTGPVVPLSTSY